MVDDDETTAVTIISSSNPFSEIEGDAFPGLVVLFGNSIGSRFELVNSEVILGRSGNVDIVIDGDGVSRQHARVVREGDVYSVEDLNSTNGTFVNDKQITKEVLSEGDQIKVGSTILKYVTSSTIEANFHEEVYRLSTIDGLTEIYNKRSFMENLERELNRFKRYGTNLSLALLDIDHFKQINDTYGHLAGDYVLKELASAIGGHLRKNDFFARYGGEEFAIIFPEVDGENAKQACEKIRAAVEEFSFLFETQKIDVTISMGLAILDEDTTVQTPSELIALADEKLYSAKHGGRNRVCI